MQAGGYLTSGVIVGYQPNASLAQCTLSKRDLIHHRSFTRTSCSYSSLSGSCSIFVPCSLVSHQFISNKYDIYIFHVQLQSRRWQQPDSVIFSG